MQASSVCVTGLARGQFTAKVSQNELQSFAAKVRSCQTQQAFGNSIACVASVSVGRSSRWRRFSLFGCAKIGASATLMEAAPAPIFPRTEKRKVHRTCGKPLVTETLATQASNSKLPARFLCQLTSCQPAHDDPAERLFCRTAPSSTHISFAGS